MNNKILRVALKDGSVREYTDGDFFDYEWRPEAFIVKNGNCWIAVYNWDCVCEVSLVDAEEADNG